VDDTRAKPGAASENPHHRATADDIEVGGFYTVTVDGRRVRVRIDSARGGVSRNGWWATILETGKQIVVSRSLDPRRVRGYHGHIGWVAP
jgi:hypothetical protein